MTREEDGMRSARIEQDLGYVREVVSRSERGGTPRAIWYLWAAIGLVGFSLIDLRPEWVPLFWTIAAPAGFFLSVWLGWRHARRIGQDSRREGWAHLLHWGGMTVAIFLLVPLAARGGLSGEALAQAILLVVSLGYFLAGVHLERPLLWVGIALVIGYLGVVYVDGYAWTAVGVLIAIALVATARVSGETPPARADSVRHRSGGTGGET